VNRIATTGVRSMAKTEVDGQASAMVDRSIGDRQED
jgi:hypothetical protein